MCTSVSEFVVALMMGISLSRPIVIYHFHMNYFSRLCFNVLCIFHFINRGLTVFQESDAGSILNTCSTACQDTTSSLCQPREGTSRPLQEFWRGQCSDWFGKYVDIKISWFC